MTDNTASAAETAPSADIAIPFPTDDVAAKHTDAASETDSQTSDPAESEVEAGADTGEGDEGATEDGESRAENEDAEQKRNKVDAKTRIKQLSGRAKEAEARATAAEARERRLAEQIDKLEKRERPGEAVDYDSDAAYAQVLVADAVAEERKRALTEAREDAAAERAQASRESWQEKSKGMREIAPDFDAVSTNPNVTITHFMKDAIVGDDHGPEVVYFLGKNPEEAARIAALNPLRQASEIGRLAERLSQAPQAKKATSATPPRKTLAGHGSPPKVDPTKLDHAEYRAWREKQQAARRRP